VSLSLGIIKRQKLYQEVYRRVRMAVLSGEFAPGERLYEHRLAEELGVSRTPVREAVLQLEREGLIKRDGGRGFVVTPITKRDVMDAYACRGAIEGLLVMRVAERVTEGDLDVLDEVLVQTEAAIKAEDIEAAMHYNSKFHECLTEIADSHIFRALCREIWTCIERYRLAALTLFREYPSYRRKYLNLLERVLDDHQELVLALRARDAEKARSIMQRHGPEVGAGVMECIQPLDDAFRYAHIGRDVKDPQGLDLD